MGLFPKKESGATDAIKSDVSKAFAPIRQIRGPLFPKFGPGPLDKARPFDL